VPPIAAGSLSLAAPRPNPAPGAITLDFALTHAGDASLDVLDAQGRRVARLFSGEQPAGPRSVVWQGPPRGHGGIYWAVLTANGDRRVRKIVVAQ